MNKLPVRAKIRLLLPRWIVVNGKCWNEMNALDWAQGRAAEVNRIRAVTMTAIRQWQAQGLMPALGRDVLVWKHVTAEGVGNLGYPYTVGEPFTCQSMGTAGPLGALRDWRRGDDNPHVLAIRALITAIQVRDNDGVFVFNRGTPIALYRAENLTDDECTLHLVEGVDALTLIQGAGE